MSTMGIVYNASCSAGSSSSSSSEQLLRTLQDNDRNLIKNNVSVISLAHSQQLDNLKPSNPQQLPAYDPSRLKKHGKNGQPPPIAVAKRNARERNRVKQVNNGFATLRQHIPSHVAQGYGDRGKKLSKVETLRMAVEYIRGLQRLLAEADGMDLGTKLRNANNDSSTMMMMIGSPAGSVYSNSTHNGSAEVLGLDEQHQEVDLMDDDEDEEHDGECGDDNDNDNDDNDDMENDEPKEKRRQQAKRLRRTQPHTRPPSRLSENQNRERCRRRENNYNYKQASFGDEENIEPLVNRNNNVNNNNNNNNNNSNHNNHNILTSFSPIFVQSASASNSVGPIKREVQLLDDDETRPSSEDDSAVNNGVILASATPYSGEIFIENPETGRLVPLKIEDHEAAAAAAAQLVYVSAEPATLYYKSELPDSAAELSWWEQECIVQQIQQQQQQQQQPAAPSQRPLAHV